MYTQYVTMSESFFWDAEVINAIAFDMNLGALDYTEEQDGTVHLLRQELLEVVLLLSSALAPAPAPLEDLCCCLALPLPMLLAAGPYLIECCCLVLFLPLLCISAPFPSCMCFHSSVLYILLPACPAAI